MSKQATQRRPQNEEHTEQQSAGVSCPECSGNLTDDPTRGETVCKDCGLVVDSDSIDRGPEWRAFDSSERSKKSRVGAPLSELQHDRGLSTEIDWKDKDSYGAPLSNRKRKQMNRLRKWHSRCQANDSGERGLRHGLGEIDRMGSALGLPDNIREIAAVIYRRATSEDLMQGRSVEGVASAATYAASRQGNHPRTLEDVARTSRVEQKEIARTYRYLNKELELKIKPPDPANYLDQIAADLECSQKIKTRAAELIESAREGSVLSGKNPLGIAAASLYAAGLLEDRSRLTQATISDAAEISEVTIRNRYREILRASGKPLPNPSHR